jgi:hypothetical protein
MYKQMKNKINKNTSPSCGICKSNKKAFLVKRIENLSAVGETP